MIFNKIEQRSKTVDVNDWKDIYNFENGYESDNSDGLAESTYFRCLRVISESVAMCSLQVKKEDDKGEKVDKNHYLSDLLRLRPNPYMSAIDCMKTFVVLAKHEGIAGLYINRGKNGKVEGLYPVKVTGTTIDNAGLIKGVKNNKILYDFVSVNDEERSCFDKDIIILRDFTLDGINTKATRTVLKQNLDTSLKSQEYLNTLFKNGMTNKIIVQLSSDLKEELDLKAIQAKFDRIYSSNGKIFTMPAGFTASALNLSLADSQYEQLRRLSKEELASMMGVPLTKLGFTKENAKSEEQDNLKFLQDTLLSVFVAIEQEADYKLLTTAERKQGYKVRFNVNVLLRMDSKTQAEVITRYTRNGIYSLNQAKDILGIEKLDEDMTLFPSGQVTLEMLQSGQVSYNKGGKFATDEVEGGDINDGDY